MNQSGQNESMVINSCFGSNNHLTMLNQLIDNQYGSKQTMSNNKKDVPKLSNLVKPDLSCLLFDDIIQENIDDE